MGASIRDDSINMFAAETRDTVRSKPSPREGQLATGREWPATIERGDNELEAKESEGRIILAR
jgi:hypothetical protein